MVMQKHSTHKNAKGFTLIASYLVLVELWNSDSSKNTDDRNDNQQFDECET